MLKSPLTSMQKAIGQHVFAVHLTSGTVWLLREKWGIATVKLNGKEHNPAQWEDDTYSVEGAAARLGVFPGTIHQWLKMGKLDF